MKVIFGEKEIDITGIRLERFIRRSELINLIYETSGKISDDLVIRRDAIDDNILKIFNDLLDVPTVWDFMKKYIINKSDVEPFIEKNNFPENMRNFAKTLDEFYYFCQDYFKFYWLESPHINKDIVEITRKYLDRVNLRGSCHMFGYLIKVNDISKYTYEDGSVYDCHVEAKNIPITSPFPYKIPDVYDYSLDHFNDLAEEDAGCFEHKNFGLVFNYWFYEFLRFIDDYRVIKEILPYTFRRSGRKPFTVQSYFRKIKRMIESDPYYSRRKLFISGDKINFVSEKHRTYYKDNCEGLNIVYGIDKFIANLERKMKKHPNFIEEKYVPKAVLYELDE